MIFDLEQRLQDTESTDLAVAGLDMSEVEQIADSVVSAAKAVLRQGFVAEVVAEAIAEAAV